MLKCCQVSPAALVIVGSPHFLETETSQRQRLIHVNQIGDQKVLTANAKSEGRHDLPKACLLVFNALSCCKHA